MVLPVALAVLLACPTAPALSQEPGLADYMEAQVESSWFMGAVLVRKGGEVLLREAYGSADLEHGVPNRVDTRFRIGSISKSFAGALLVLSAGQGELDLEDEVSVHLPDVPEAWKGIRLSHLLHHRSGIPDIEGLEDFGDWKRHPTRPRATMECFTDEELDFEPGKRFSYSSSGYIVIAAVLEQVTGRSWEELLADRLCGPLGLAGTANDSGKRIVPNRARGYSADGPGLLNADFLDMLVPIGGGDLHSTVDDLDRWVRGLWAGQLAPRETFFDPEPIARRTDAARARRVSGVEVSEGGGYAAGWFVGRRGDRAIVQHGGAIHGFGAYLAWYPDEDLSVVVLCNVDVFELPQRIGEDLAAIVFGETVELPVVRREVPGGRRDPGELRGRLRVRAGGPRDHGRRGGASRDALPAPPGARALPDVRHGLLHQGEQRPDLRLRARRKRARDRAPGAPRRSGQPAGDTPLAATSAASPGRSVRLVGRRRGR